MNFSSILEDNQISKNEISDGDITITTPIDGSKIAQVNTINQEKLEETISLSSEAFKRWRNIPAPSRGEFVRLLGNHLRKNKEKLAKLVCLESGKIYQEGLGEVQEMIDICDFACGLSRQLYGLTIVSERPSHHMRETWHPLGITAVISAFNFPVAVWAWNTAIALVCGNTIIWKPSELTPLCAIALKKIIDKVIFEFGDDAKNICLLAIGDKQIGIKLIEDSNIALISATGSSLMGKHVAKSASLRFCRTILELGGNNAMIVSDKASLDLAIPAIVFSAVGTAGQRCTSLRRLIVQENIYPQVIEKLKKAYKTLIIGNPLDEANLIGPLISKQAYINMQDALAMARLEDGDVFGGQRKLEKQFPNAFYVSPAIVEMPNQTEIVKQETFAPILYVLAYEKIEEAIFLQNNVPQGLSSSIFTNDICESELFLSSIGSDCGIANVNIGPSGAEIGGAFGGEKATGGGRESGSDAYRGYMRRQTVTINYSNKIALAQNIKFKI